MNTAKQELLEKKRLSNIISDWVGKNKKIFWKYEVSYFYKTYMIRVNSLPEPSEKDILLSPNNRLMSGQQKTQLCDALVKACAGTTVFNNSSVDFQIDYEDGAVIAEVV